MEALGATASAIAIAQLVQGAGKALMKLNNLLKEVKDVPEDVQEKIDQLNIFIPLLQGIESQFNQPNVSEEVIHSPAMIMSLAHCTGAVRKLQDLVNDMDAEIKRTDGRKVKRKIAMTRIVLKKETVLRLEKKLKDAITILDLSLHHYTIALQHATHATQGAILRAVKMRTESENDDQEEDSAFTEQMRGLAFIRKGCGCSHLRPKSYEPAFFGRIWREAAPDGSCHHYFFQMPSWLGLKVWEAEFRMAPSGWQQFGAVRCYNVRPSSAPVFQYVENGMTDALFRLFDTHEASPFDRDEYGRSLIYYAADNNHLTICRTLLSLGLDICLDEKAKSDAMTAREITAMWSRSCEPEKDPDFLQEKLAIIDLFHSVEYYHYSPDDTALLISQGLYDGEYGKWKAEVLSHFQKRLVPTYFKLPLRVRLEAVRTTVLMKHRSIERDFPDMMRTLLTADRRVTPEDVSASIREGLSLIHTTAMALASGGTDTWREGGNSGAHHRWPFFFRLASDVIRAAKPEELHAVETADPPDDGERDNWDGWTGTPLAYLLRGVRVEAAGITFGNWDENYTTQLRRWLEVLKACNVDLVEYGRVELAILQRLRDSKPGRIRRVVYETKHWVGGGPMPRIPVELSGFSYGPEPDDWVLQWEAGPEIKNERDYRLWAEDRFPRVVEVVGGETNDGEATDGGETVDELDEVPRRADESVCFRVPGGWVD
ncbi:hypothetical protein B0T22DRAFT_191508 [Podospora appendiculata]|uniref:NACHT-NTPase and P-loop NTPases N-terminal domain-containing protein n=1 Tax=Podospora appendiculata TaxID=314037 RepID=A0AAE0XD89_9PEZI|nr:hypothetical protein B0T22DRAFT_191508 [Podospora appendiculata]